MIPFRLFKYIFVRYIIYAIILGLCMGCVIGFIYGFISGFLSAGFKLSLENNTIKGIIALLTVICYILGYFYISKITFEKVIFKPYKKIKIDTNMKKISNRFIILFLCITILSTIPSIGIINLITSFISNYIFAMVLCFIINTFIGYGVINFFLEKYIKVSEIPNETQNKK